MAAEPDPSTRRIVGGRDLPVAIAVGVVLAGGLVASLVWHPLAFVGFLALLTSVAYVEVRAVLRRVGHDLDVPVVVAATLVLLVGASQARHAGQVIGLLVLVLGAFAWHLADRRRTDVVRSAATTVLFGLWIGFLASFAVLLVDRPDGVVLVLTVIGAAVVTDIGGFAAGVRFGRHRIAPHVSPNKTWEGLAGGVLSATVLAAIVLPLVGGPLGALEAAVVALVCGLASFVGDLVESMVKRDLGIKDLGRILPGHGGVLDRVDGILWALPVGFFAVELLVV
jgi:phosphatidate cytidylyltransferase